MKTKEKFGFRVGDMVKLNEDCIHWCYGKPNGILAHKARMRRYTITGFEEELDDESVRLKRRGRTEYYYYSFLTRVGVEISEHIYPRR